MPREPPSVNEATEVPSQRNGLSIVKVVRSASFGTGQTNRRRPQGRAAAAAQPLSQASDESQPGDDPFPIASSSLSRQQLEQQRAILDEATYVFGDCEPPSKPPSKPDADQFGWLAQQMEHIDAGEKKETFQEKMQLTRQMRLVAFQRESELLEARLKKMRTALPPGLPPGLPPPPPGSPSQLRNGVAYDEGEYVDGKTLRARADTSHYTSNYTPKSSGGGKESSPPTSTAPGYRCNYDTSSSRVAVDGSLSRI